MSHRKGRWYNFFMKIVDRVYGQFEITSQVLVDLIQSEPLQRLKKIAQCGMPNTYSHIKSYSRYEHCVGVMLVLRKLGASEEEQIAGLLHDVSHTAFSHVVDWVVGAGKIQDFQDNHHKEYIKKTIIPQILAQYGYSSERIVAYKHFGLLERDLPELCADRLDYAVREFPETVANECICDLLEKEGRIVFQHEDKALLFAEHFLQRQMENWGGFESASRYRIFADVLRYAMEQNIITMDDLWQYDDFVVKKLLLANDTYITTTLHALERKSLKALPKSNEVVYTKFRYIDPLFLKDGVVVKLSEVNEVFHRLVKSAKEENEKGIRVPVIG